MKHGLYKHKSRGARPSKIQRCTNPKNPSFKNYGGRGIVVCERWRNDFAVFLADMGPRPSPAHTIERKKNNGNYEPGNCKWATRGEQLRNTRRTIFVVLDGKRMCLRDAATAKGVSYQAVCGRYRDGVRGAGLFVPSRRRKVTWNGKRVWISHLAEEFGLAQSTVASRLEMGWSLEKAITTPAGAYQTGEEWRNAH